MRLIHLEQAWAENKFTAEGAMIASRETPLAEYDSRRCDACSLIDLCPPKALRFKRGAAAWFSNQLAAHQTAFTGESDS